MSDELRRLTQAMALDPPRLLPPVSINADCDECGDQGPCIVCERGRRVIADTHERAVAAQHRRRFDRAWDRLGLKDEFRSLSLDTYPDKTKASYLAVRDFALSWQRVDRMGVPGRGLALVGAYGTGKTGLLVGALRHVMQTHIDRSFTVVWWDAARLYQALRDGMALPYGQRGYGWEVDRCVTCSLLVLDDVGAEKPTEWTREQLGAIVNQRYEHRRPIWLTSNYGPTQLDAPDFVGGRTVDRLAHMCQWVHVGGGNLRRGIDFIGDPLPPEEL